MSENFFRGFFWGEKVKEEEGENVKEEEGEEEEVEEEEGEKVKEEEGEKVKEEEGEEEEVEEVEPPPFMEPQTPPEDYSPPRPGEEESGEEVDIWSRLATMVKKEPKEEPEEDEPEEDEPEEEEPEETDVSSRARRLLALINDPTKSSEHRAEARKQFAALKAREQERLALLQQQLEAEEALQREREQRRHMLLQQQRAQEAAIAREREREREQRRQAKGKERVGETLDTPPTSELREDVTFGSLLAGLEKDKPVEEEAERDLFASFFAGVGDTPSLGGRQEDVPVIRQEGAGWGEKEIGVVKPVKKKAEEEEEEEGGGGGDLFESFFAGVGGDVPAPVEDEPAVRGEGAVTIPGGALRDIEFPEDAVFRPGRFSNFGTEAGAGAPPREGRATLDPSQFYATLFFDKKMEAPGVTEALRKGTLEIISSGVLAVSEDAHKLGVNEVELDKGIVLRYVEPAGPAADRLKIASETIKESAKGLVDPIGQDYSAEILQVAQEVAAAKKKTVQDVLLSMISTGVEALSLSALTTTTLRIQNRMLAVNAIAPLMHNGEVRVSVPGPDGLTAQSNWGIARDVHDDFERRIRNAVARTLMFMATAHRGATVGVTANPHMLEGKFRPNGFKVRGWTLNVDNLFGDDSTIAGLVQGLAEEEPWEELAKMDDPEDKKVRQVLLKLFGLKYEQYPTITFDQRGSLAKFALLVTPVFEKLISDWNTQRRKIDAKKPVATTQLWIKIEDEARRAIMSAGVRALGWRFQQSDERASALESYHDLRVEAHAVGSYHDYIGDLLTKLRRSRRTFANDGTSEPFDVKAFRMTELVELHDVNKLMLGNYTPYKIPIILAVFGGKFVTLFDTPRTLPDIDVRVLGEHVVKARQEYQAMVNEIKTILSSGLDTATLEGVGGQERLAIMRRLRNVYTSLRFDGILLFDSEVIENRQEYLEQGLRKVRRPIPNLDAALRAAKASPGAPVEDVPPREEERPKTVVVPAARIDLTSSSVALISLSKDALGTDYFPRITTAARGVTNVPQGVSYLFENQDEGEAHLALWKRMNDMWQAQLGGDRLRFERHEREFQIQIARMLKLTYEKVERFIRNMSRDSTLKMMYVLHKPLTLRLRPGAGLGPPTDEPLVDFPEPEPAPEPAPAPEPVTEQTVPLTIPLYVYSLLRLSEKVFGESEFPRRMDRFEKNDDGTRTAVVKLAGKRGATAYVGKWKAELDRWHDYLSADVPLRFEGLNREGQNALRELVMEFYGKLEFLVNRMAPDARVKVSYTVPAPTEATVRLVLAQEVRVKEEEEEEETGEVVMLGPIRVRTPTLPDVTYITPDMVGREKIMHDGDVDVVNAMLHNKVAMNNIYKLVNTAYGMVRELMAGAGEGEQTVSVDRVAAFEEQLQRAVTVDPTPSKIPTPSDTPTAPQNTALAWLELEGVFPDVLRRTEDTDGFLGRAEPTVLGDSPLLQYDSDPYMKDVAKQELEVLEQQESRALRIYEDMAYVVSAFWANDVVGKEVVEIATLETLLKNLQNTWVRPVLVGGTADRLAATRVVGRIFIDMNSRLPAIVDVFEADSKKVGLRGLKRLAKRYYDGLRSLDAFNALLKRVKKHRSIDRRAANLLDDVTVAPIGRATVLRELKITKDMDTLAAYKRLYPKLRSNRIDVVNHMQAWLAFSGFLHNLILQPDEDLQKSDVDAAIKKLKKTGHRYKKTILVNTPKTEHASLDFKAQPGHLGGFLYLARFGSPATPEVNTKRFLVNVMDKTAGEVPSEGYRDYWSDFANLVLSLENVTSMTGVELYNRVPNFPDALKPTEPEPATAGLAQLRAAQDRTQVLEALDNLHINYAPLTEVARAQLRTLSFGLAQGVVVDDPKSETGFKRVHVWNEDVTRSLKELL